MKDYYEPFLFLRWFEPLAAAQMSLRTWSKTRVVSAALVTMISLEIVEVVDHQPATGATVCDRDPGHGCHGLAAVAEDGGPATDPDGSPASLSGVLTD